MDRYKEWLEKLPKDDPLYEELLAIKDDETEIKERFFQDLKFVKPLSFIICEKGTEPAPLSGV